MVTWCFCFVLSVFIVLVELVDLIHLLPLSWQDFTSAFSVMAALMNFTSSIIYPVSLQLGKFCSGKDCIYYAITTVMSCLCFITYAIEMRLTQARPEGVSSFLTTVPGRLKVFEAYVPCLIFFLAETIYEAEPGMLWCLAVYVFNFITTMLIIILVIGRCFSNLPFRLERAVLGYNILATHMYLMATIMWSLYSFENDPESSECVSGDCTGHIDQIAVSFLSFLNFVAYSVDLTYCCKVASVTSPA